VSTNKQRRVIQLVLFGNSSVILGRFYLNRVEPTALRVLFCFDFQQLNISAAAFKGNWASGSLLRRPTSTKTIAAQNWSTSRWLERD